MSNEFFNNSYVKEKFGVEPSLVVELLALVGDKADNIPGITKVGNKTASKWLNAYGNLENVLKNSDEITGVVGENLRKEKEVLLNSKIFIKNLNLTLLLVIQTKKENQNTKLSEIEMSLIHFNQK